MVIIKYMCKLQIKSICVLVQKIHSSIEDYGPYNWDSSEQYEPTGYDFCCSYLSQKIGTKIKVIVRDTDGYEYSKKFKIKNRAPKIQIDTLYVRVGGVGNNK